MKFQNASVFVLAVAGLSCQGASVSTPPLEAPGMDPLAELRAELEVIHSAHIDSAVERGEFVAAVGRDREGVDRDLRTLRWTFTGAGTARELSAPGLQIRAEDLGVAESSPEALAQAFLEHFGGLFGVPTDAAARFRTANQDQAGATSHSITQWHGDVPVEGAEFTIIVRSEPLAIVGARGGFVPTALLRGIGNRPTVARDTLTADGSNAELVVWSNYRDVTEPTLPAWMADGLLMHSAPRSLATLPTLLSRAVGFFGTGLEPTIGSRAVAGPLQPGRRWLSRSV